MRTLLSFLAGFFATLIFHQLTLALLWWVRVAPFAPFSMAATQPFGIPAVLSLAFWGGVWGILFGMLDNRFPSGSGYWITAFVFGAVFPTLVALLLVLPLKGQTHRRWLARASATDGSAYQRRLGDWHRSDS